MSSATKSKIATSNLSTQKTMFKDMIVAKGLTKSFKNFTAVDGIDFTVKKGEIFAFLGPNGAGKSTTIKMLTTLLEPTGGALTLAGFDVLSQKSDVRNSFGIVFQDPSVDDELTALENMVLHATFYDLSKPETLKRSEELLNLVELWDRKDSLVKTFSGGMKRRLEIARGLLHEPKVLFLDEPTVGLDAQTRNLLWHYVARMSKTKDMTVFFTTHYLEEAEQYAERIAIIDHGHIIASGTTSSLKKQTSTKTLEEAYLKLTGHSTRDDSSDADLSARQRVRSRGRK